MNRFLQRAVMTVLGLVVMLAWWSIRGGDSNVVTEDSIPATVWGGGGGTLTVEVHASCAAKLLVNFEGQEDEQSLNSWQEVEGGTHTWTIDVPREVGGYMELNAIDPPTGDTLSWQVRLNDAVVDEQFDQLQEPLENGYAFFIQAYYDDFSTGQLASDW